jgi:hypothetical protein
MVKRTKNNRELNRFNEENDLASITSISSPYTPSSHTKANNLSDDLIVSLSDAYENRRARQVFEWEMSQKRTLRSAV